MAMKVLFIDHSPYEGGAEVSLKELMTNLDPIKYQTILIAPRDATYVDEILRGGSRVIGLNFDWKKYGKVMPLFKDLMAVVKIIREEKPQIVHTNTRVTNILGGLLYTMKLFDPVLAKIKFINHVRDLDPLPTWKFKLIGSADQIVANSEQVKNFLIKGGIPSTKIATIYNGVNLNVFDPAKFPRTDHDRPALLFIGQIYPRKGLNYLIEALVEIKKEFSNIVLRIVGQDPTTDQQYLGEYMLHAENLGLKPNIEWMGYLDYQTKIPEVLSQTDIFVLPSLEEPFGRVIVDAMAMEVPVVATDVGGVPEIVQDSQTSYLVPPQDASSLAVKTIELLRDPAKRKEFGRKGREVVKSKLSIQKHIELIENLYAKLYNRA
jgi:glycosyltransferase involved in cell wall biosynthesis